MVKYKAVMDPAIAGQFVKRFATTIVSTVSTLSIEAANGRVVLVLEATTYLGEDVLREALSSTGEFAEWGYNNRFRAPASAVVCGSKT